MLKFIYIALFLVLLYAPIIILTINSFNMSLYGIGWDGFTWQWYQSLKSNTSLLNAAKNSLILAMTSSILAILFGIFSSFAMYKYKFPGRKLLFFSIQSMIVFPDIIFAVSLLMLFILFNINLGFISIFLSHAALTAPFASLIIFLGFKKIEVNILEAAKDLGASDWQIFSKIFIPLVTPNIMAAFLISFTLSFDDVIISNFVNGPSYELLPLKILSLARLSMKPDINAICVIILLITIILIGLSQFLLRNKKYV